MKIFVLKSKRLLLYFVSILLITSLIVAICSLKPNIKNVFNVQRELPIYYVDTQDKKVSITFDCAWGADDIPDILNTLKNEDVKASFFIVGDWAKKYPNTVNMIADGGHDIANHSNSHLRMGSINNSKIKSEITLCGEKLKEITGQEIELFRPPYGDYNDSVIKIARELGYYTIQWNIDSLDWKEGISGEEISNRVIKNVKNGSIILFHNDTPHTAKVLPSIIKSLKSKGYSIVPVSEMIIRENYSIDYDGRQMKKEK